MNIIIKIIYQASRLLLLIFKPITVGVRILMIREDRVLLVKHVYEDKWYLPGGLVEREETLEQAVRREAFEEVGATIEDLQFVGTYTNLKMGRSDHISVFLTRDFSLNGHSDHEIERYAYFPLDSLPSTISAGSKNRIRDFLDGNDVRYGVW